MSPVDGLLLLVALAAAAGWWSGLRAREATDREGLQLLDSAVAGARSGIVRGAGGRLELHRRYRFEFSDDGLRRLDGEVRLRGRRVIGVTLAPWKADASEGPDPLAPAADPTRARVAPASWTVVRGGRHGRTPGPG